jgi:hypothetical protein
MLIEVSSLRQFEDVCAGFSEQGKAYFRGQTVDYPQVLPSLFRPGAPYQPAFEDLICRLYIECYEIDDWRDIRRRQVETFQASFDPPHLGIMNEWGIGTPFDLDWMDEIANLGGPSVGNYRSDDYTRVLSASFEENWGKHSDALLQHYGIPSRALDITDDPFIALWFAANIFKRNLDETATYVPAKHGNGVVYVFANTEIDLISLQAFALARDFEFSEGIKIPYYGLRGIRQKGLLMFGATERSPDLRKHVSAVIRIVGDDWTQGALVSRGCNYPSLIPPPSIDPFYQALLNHRDNADSEYASVAKHIIRYVYE